jgi:putative transposase
MTRYRIVADQALYFVTFSVVEWLPVFVEEQPCRIIVDSFNFCHEKKHLRTNVFVIMPTHLHAIVFDAEYDSERLRSTLADLRKFTGQQLTKYCLASAPHGFGMVLQRAAGKDRQHRFWQGGVHPEAIFTQPFWRQKLDYVHDNPRRKGLVREASDWRFSSASFWLSEGESEVVLTAVEW